MNVIPGAAFIDRFTASERLAVRNAAKTDPQVDDLLYLLDAAAQVNLTDPTTTEGMQRLVTLGLITPDRSAVIQSLHGSRRSFT